MPLLTSSNRNLVGVASIDDGHGAIIGIINDLHAAMLKGRAEEVVCGILDRLLNFTQKHLPVEESLLESSGYPELARHRGRHQELTGGISKFVLRHKRGDKDMIVHLARFLWDWLSIHVRQEDRESCSLAQAARSQVRCSLRRGRWRTNASRPSEERRRPEIPDESVMRRDPASSTTIVLCPGPCLMASSAIDAFDLQPMQLVAVASGGHRTLLARSGPAGFSQGRAQDRAKSIFRFLCEEFNAIHAAYPSGIALLWPITLLSCNSKHRNVGMKTLRAPLSESIQPARSSKIPKFRIVQILLKESEWE